jgi:hypothetical protein
MYPDVNETKKFDTDAHAEKYFTPEQIEEEPEDEEPEEKKYVYTYAFFCAEGIEPADQLDQDFYDIHSNGECFVDYGELEQAECICTSEDPGKTSGQISVNDLKEFLEGIDQRATDDEDEEIPPEYYEGIFETTNEIRRKFGIPLSNN